jgi:hypothetical protein
VEAVAARFPQLKQQVGCIGVYSVGGGAWGHSYYGGGVGCCDARSVIVQDGSGGSRSKVLSAEAAGGSQLCLFWGGGGGAQLRWGEGVATPGAGLDRTAVNAMAARFPQLKQQVGHVSGLCVSAETC